jgi:serine/threonine protein kinase
MSTATDAQFQDRVGSLLCGKWTIERLLGVGGMAAVYLARHKIGHYDAIKILHPAFARDPKVCERFEREARAVNRFRHPGAVAVRDIDVTEDGSPFLVMEYLEGESLARYAKRGLAKRRLLEIIDELLDVLSAAHAEGIIHRDTKPANLFILGNGRLKVLDFGIARMHLDRGAENLTHEGALLGTATYMPPEQAMGRDIDPRADIFAVGAVMFRLLGRRNVHIAPTEGQVLVLMATQPAPELASVAPDTPRSLCLIVDRALRFSRDERYPDAPTMQGDIRALLDGRAPSYAAGLAGIASSSGASQAVEPVDLSGELPHSDIDSLLGSLIGGRYRPERLLGRGGMGSVYEATDARMPGRRVALKAIHPHLALEGSAARGRFKREAQTASGLDNPFVVRVHDVDIDSGGTPFIVMDLLEGQDLEHCLKLQKPLNAQTAVRLFKQACRGVAAAHTRNIVHRDIKPANLFLHRPSTDDGGRALTVKILDFGLAKSIHNELGASQSGLTETGGVLGTPKYASPEQLTNAKYVDARSDVWSLCISLYEALGGKQPWQHCETVGELIVSIVTTDVPPLRELAPWVEPALAAVVDRGLRRIPAERWADAAALLEALAPFDGGSEQLTEDMLRDAVDTNALTGPHLPRALPASHAVAPSGPTAASQSQSGPSLLGVASDAEIDGLLRRKRKTTRAALALGLVGLAALGALGAVFLVGSSPAPTTAPGGRTEATSELDAAERSATAVPSQTAAAAASAEPTAEPSDRAPPSPISTSKRPTPASTGTPAATATPAAAAASKSRPKLEFKHTW